MGSCVSSPINNNTSGSALKLQMSSLVPDDHHKQPNSIPSTPIKEKQHSSSAIVVNKSQVSPRNSFGSYRSHGSKDEAFYDTQGWLDSDCEDDFYSVNGDFTPSRGNTPVHRTFSPQVNRALFDGRPPRRSVSNRSRGSTPLHRSSSAISPLANGAISEGSPVSNPESSSTTKKKKKLADLFRESIRERAGEGLFFGDYENESSPNPSTHVLPPKSANRAPTSVSGANSVSSSGKRTPTADDVPENDKSVKAAQQCCFPRLVSSRSFRENKRASSPSMKMDDLKA